jgi:predicted MFS family arabinose efflux permease
VTIRRASNEVPGGLPAWQLAVLAAGTFTLGVDGFVLSGLLPSISADLSVSISAAGQLVTIFSITYALGSPIIATLTGSWDRRALLGGGMGLFLLGMAGQALAPSFAVMAAGRAVAAVGAAAFQSNAYVLAGVLAGEQRRARALAAVTAGSMLATVLGVPFGVLLGQWLGWRAVLWTIVALAAVIAAIVPRLPRAHVPPTTMRARLGTLARPPVLAVLAGTVAVVAPPFLLMSYLPAVLGTSALGSRLVLVLLAFGIGGVCGNRVVGRLVDGRGALPVLLIGVGGGAVAYAMLAAAQSWYVPTLVLVFVVGAFYGLTITPQQHRMFVLAPDVATVALGLNGSAIYLGAALGAALGGITLEVTDASALPAAAGLLSAAAVGLIAATAPEWRRRAAARRADPAGPAVATEAATGAELPATAQVGAD